MYVLLMKLRLSLCRRRTESFPFIILLKAITECQDRVCNQGLCVHQVSICTSNLAECVRVLDSQTRKGRTASKEAAFKLHTWSLVLKNIQWVGKCLKGRTWSPTAAIPLPEPTEKLVDLTTGKVTFPFPGTVQICFLIQKG